MSTRTVATTTTVFLPWDEVTAAQFLTSVTARMTATLSPKATQNTFPRFPLVSPCSSHRTAAFRNPSLLVSQVSLLRKTSPADKEQERAAENFHRVEIFSKVFVKRHEPADPDSGEQEGDGQARRIDGQEQDAPGDGVAGCRGGQDRGEDRADARRPAKSESKTEQEAAPRARLPDGAAKMDVAIEPAGQGRAEET